MLLVIVIGEFRWERKLTIPQITIRITEDRTPGDHPFGDISIYLSPTILRTSPPIPRISRVFPPISAVSSRSTSHACLLPLLIPRANSIIFIRQKESILPHRDIDLSRKQRRQQSPNTGFSPSITAPPVVPIPVPFPVSVSPAIFRRRAGTISRRTSRAAFAGLGR